MQPWDPTEQFLLCLEVSFSDRPPGADDKASVGVVELSSSRFIHLADTSAWNFQQGAMLHWSPNSSGSEIIFNDRQGRTPVSVILNLRTKEQRTLSRPISALSHDGKTALSINFGRLHWASPGYGYAGINDPSIKNPDDDGVFSMDINGKGVKRIVSLADVLAIGNKSGDLANQPLVFNHTAFSPDDRRFAFLVQWRVFTFPKWARLSRLKKLWKLNALMFTANVDGTDLRQVAYFENISHFDWKNSNEILMWAQLKDEEGFFLTTVDGYSYRRIGEKFLTEDGHCSFSPDGKWVLVDTYPNEQRFSTLKLYNWAEGDQTILGKFYADPKFVGEIRCDLHPRWNRNGLQVCFDSVHESTRQVYVLDIFRTQKF